MSGCRAWSLPEIPLFLSTQGAWSSLSGGKTRFSGKLQSPGLDVERLETISGKAYNDDG